MKRFPFVLGLLLSLAGNALAALPPGTGPVGLVAPLQCALTDFSSVVVTGGTPVTIAAVANRNILRITNPATLAQQFASGGVLESIWINETGAAGVAGATSTEVPPGQTYTTDLTGTSNQAISINAATSLHRFVAKGC